MTDSQVSSSSVSSNKYVSGSSYQTPSYGLTSSGVK